MGYLMDNPIHPTVDQIYKELHPSIPTLSKTTVYNTLKLLEDNGVIRSILIDEKNVRYDANLDVHAHFKCKECGAIFDLWIENPEVLIENISNFNVTECLVYYVGYCKDCKKSMSN